MHPLRKKLAALETVRHGPQIVFLTVSPGDLILLSGGPQQQFVATGHYLDGSTATLTTQAIWSSTDTLALPISNAPGERGKATPVGNGTAIVIRARFGSLIGEVVITVGLNLTVFSAGVAVLPGTVAFTRSSPGHSVQTGASTIITSGMGGNDTPRIGRATAANALALVFEESRTNTLKDNRDPTTASWNPLQNMTRVRPSGTAPDGSTTTQTRYSTVITNAFANYQGFANDALSHALSMWVRSATGVSAPARRQFGEALTFEDYTATAAHARVETIYAGAGPTYFFEPCERLVGGQDVEIDLGQNEIGKFSTETIITGATAVARAGEHLNGTTSVTDAGQVRLYLRGRPKGSSNSYASDLYLWKIDSNNHCRISNTTGSIIFTVGGVSYTTATAMSWAAHDLFEVFVGSGGSVPCTASYRVGGAGSWTTLSTGSPTVFGPIVQSGSIDLLCNATSNQFTGRWEELTFYRAGVTPVT